MNLMPDPYPSARDARTCHRASRPAVRDALGLAERALERMRREYLDAYRHPDLVLHVPFQPSGERRTVVRADRLVRLDLHGELVERSGPGQHTQVVRRQSLDL